MFQSPCSSGSLAHDGNRCFRHMAKTAKVPKDSSESAALTKRQECCRLRTGVQTQTGIRRTVTGAELAGGVGAV